MIGPLALILAEALATGLPADGPGPSIRWEAASSGATSSVSLVGLSPEAVRVLGDPAWTADRWPGLFSITVESRDPRSSEPPSMLGTYRLEGDTLRFTPRFPMDRGRTYVATYRPWRVPGGSGVEFTTKHRIDRPPTPPTVVPGVSPSGDRLPENLLKFYLHFSSPMSRGSAYDHVRLLKADGQAVDLPFLRLVEELWDPTGTRLTLLIDPGRIKRGLKPREEQGPVLEAGRTYTLAIDPAWPDAEGRPLGAGFRKTFRAGPEDNNQPDPRAWKLEPPAAGSRAPLTLTFPEALDAALLRTALILRDPRGEEVEGSIEVLENETRWRFAPQTPWIAGTYDLVIDDELEDLAGNTLRRPFEVDIQRDTPLRPESRPVHWPVAIRAR